MMKAYDTADEDGRFLASVFPASADSVRQALELPITNEDSSVEGRSEYIWVRLANGDLIFGFFPQGPGYESLEVAVERDFTAAKETM